MSLQVAFLPSNKPLLRVWDLICWFFDEAGLERIPAFEWLISFAASQISGWQKQQYLEVVDVDSSIRK